MVIIAERLKTLRENLNITQIKLSELAGSNQSSINRYENNQADVPTKILIWYADYFDVSMDYIFGRTDKPQGKVYNYQPDAIKQKFDNQEQWGIFIEACFDPGSPMNAKLKEMLMKMTEGEVQ